MATITEGVNRWSFSSLLLYLLVVLMAIPMVYPFVYTISTSFLPVSEMFKFPPQIIPHRPTIEHYIKLIKEQNILLYTFNTIFWVVTSLVLTTFFNSLAGFVFAKYEFRYKKELFAFLLGTMMVPTTAMLVPSYLVLLKLRMVNNYWGLIIPGITSAFNIFMMRQYMLSIPTELMDAARTDGCSEFGLYWRVGIPLSKPILGTSALLHAMGTWNEYMWPAVILRSENLYPLAVKVANLNDIVHRTDFGLLAAAAAWMTFPFLLLFIIFNRQFIEGFTNSITE
ncbi:MAG: carbohydrate ABC transporter permease [Firmicutes bacterium]|nr:carbohydrate ABC transporter permease [Bacillota bacterium]